MNAADNTYTIQDLSIPDICARFGTPLYIYDGAMIIRQLQNLREAFSENDLRIKFAAKALTNISILSLLRKHGAGVDVVSINEAHLAIHAGFPPAEINYTPNCVGFDEILEGVGMRLNINLDNLPVLEKFGKKFGGSYPCGIRLNPNILAGGNLKISTGHRHSKFGISVEQLPAINDLVNKFKMVINGLHIHTGSEIADTQVFMKMADIFFGMADKFPALEFLDFGGGFKVAYGKEDRVTDMKELGSRLGTAFLDFQKKTGRRLQLWLEPGKYLVSEAGYLIVKVNVVKATPDLTFVGVNSGLNHLLRPMMYGAYHEIVNVTNPKGARQLYTVVGNICETDTLGEDRKLNEVRENDLLAILNAGAYGYAMASNYNSRARPPEVLILDGKAHLIRERDTLEDLLRGQVDVVN